MKYLLLLFSSFAFPVAAQSTAPPLSPFITSLIESAEAKIVKSPAIAEGYGDLAFALTRRARETEDLQYAKQAETAIGNALKLDPRFFDARKARVMIRLLQGRFADAEEEARALNKQTPDDNLIYGFLTDALIARGQFTEAEALTQRMLDLRQVNGPGLQRAAQIREIIGFPDGAVEFWNSSLRLASVSDTEERAYILTQLAQLCRRLARLHEAARYAADALRVQPDYPAALIEQARIALEQKKPDLALAALTKRLAQGNSAKADFWLAEAQTALGNSAVAKQAADRFLALAQTPQNERESRDDLLVMYLTQHRQAAEAIRIGKSATEHGASLDMRDAYAVALLAGGDAREAKKQIEEVLRPGVKNPRYFLHAAQIAKRSGDAEAARSYFMKCIEVNASSRDAAAAFLELGVPPGH